MDNKSTRKLLEKAEQALDVTGGMSAYKLLKPLLAEENPAALFLYSTFSIEQETEEEFEERRMKLLRMASEAEYIPAIYELAVCYDLGEFIERDPVRAAVLYKKTADAGYSKGKLSHGLDLFYGSNGMQKDEQQGLNLIRQAAAENIDGAIEFLESMEPKFCNSVRRIP